MGKRFRKPVDERSELQHPRGLRSCDREVLGDGQILEQFQRLESAGETASEPLVRTHPVQRRPVQKNLAGSDPRETRDRVDQGGLPRAVGPDQARHLPCGQGERHVMQDLDLAIAGAQRVDLQADAHRRTTGRRTTGRRTTGGRTL